MNFLFNARTLRRGGSLAIAAALMAPLEALADEPPTHAGAGVDTVDCPPGAVCERIPSTQPEPATGPEPAAPASEPVSAEPPAPIAAPSTTPAAVAPPPPDWHPGAPVPPGYHVSSEPNEGLLVAGAVTFGLGYVPGLIIGGVIAAAAGSPEAMKVLALPFVVPAVMVAVPDFSDTVHGIGGALLGTQLGGVMLVGLAFAASSNTLVPDVPIEDYAEASATALATPRVTVAPALSPAMLGVTVGGTM